ncbi:Polypyrimidine tract-binding protein like 3, partial [Glycine soja]
LVQMQHVPSAVNALKFYANVQPNISLDELQVNYNNDRSRDFTNPDLPTEQKGKPSQPGYGDVGNMYPAQDSRARAGAKYFKLLWLKIDEDKLLNLFSIYGNIMRIKLLLNKLDHTLI